MHSATGISHSSTQLKGLRFPSCSEYCRIAKPIGYSTKDDSIETVAAIEAHNSAWACVCEGDCPDLTP